MTPTTQTRQTPAAAERATPLELPPEEFRRLGHDLVDRIAEFLGGLRDRPLTTGETPAEIRQLLGRAPLPATGDGAAASCCREADTAAVRSLALQRPPAVHGLHHLVRRAARRAGRPARRQREPQRRRLGALADGLGDRGADGALGGRAGGISDRRGRAAGERRQHGQLRLLPGRAARDAGRGGAGRRASAASGPPLRVYASAGTHTWIQKACDLFGLGTDAIRWIPTDAAQRMRAGRAPRADCRRPGARGPADPGGGHRRAA